MVKICLIESYSYQRTLKREWRLSYLNTKDNAEIDLIVERPGQPLLCIEIKSSNRVGHSDFSTLTRLASELGNCEMVCFSNISERQVWDNVTVWPWQEGIKHYWGYHENHNVKY